MFGWMLFGWLLFGWLLFGWLLFGWLQILVLLLCTVDLYQDLHGWNLIKTAFSRYRSGISGSLSTLGIRSGSLSSSGSSGGSGNSGSSGSSAK